MLKLALAFLFAGVIAASIGYAGLAEGAVSTAKVLFCLFLILFGLSAAARHFKAPPSDD